MAIFRGAGGSGDATSDASISAVTDLTLRAEEAANTASIKATTATTKANAASASATDASNLATAAATSATNAGVSETNASASAATAATQATNAANSATAAASSASTAATSETNAASSATDAQTAQTAAEAAETNAATSASAAASSASSASSSASTATTQATNAASSASAAATSASNAATSETNASNSATAASTSASNADTSATAAATSASNAATSETNAATSASNAATSASNAATSASAASSSASSAATSETNAASSASSASTSASNASLSETNAATSASNASTDAALVSTLYDSFDDRYLGDKALAPSVDNDGDPLATGALYFDTTTNGMKVYDGSVWLDAYASASGTLSASANLSDLSNTATARSNLGLGSFVSNDAIGAEVVVISTAGSKAVVGDQTITPSSTSAGTLTINNTAAGQSLPENAADGNSALRINTTSTTSNRYQGAISWGSPLSTSVPGAAIIPRTTTNGYINSLNFTIGDGAGTDDLVTPLYINAKDSFGTRGYVYVDGDFYISSQVTKVHGNTGARVGYVYMDNTDSGVDVLIDQNWFNGWSSGLWGGSLITFKAVGISVNASLADMVNSRWFAIPIWFAPDTGVLTESTFVTVTSSTTNSTYFNSTKIDGIISGGEVYLRLLNRSSAPADSTTDYSWEVQWLRF